jgi:Tol biopolymer transport system component
MFCTACAAHNPLTSNFCIACGAPLGKKRAAPANHSDQSRSRLMYALIYVIPLAMLLLTLGFIVQRVQSERDASASAYADAEAALAGGDYEAAIALFADAGDHLDAAARREATVALLAPYQANYLDGLAALDDGGFEEAVTELLPVATNLPRYRDAMVLLEEARHRWQEELIRQANIAEEEHDWLTAERALSQAVINDPANADLPVRLSELRKHHSPMVYTWNGALYMTGPDLADERLITSEVEAILPVWSPDRTKIAFYSAETEDVENSVRLYVVDVDGSNLKMLADEVYSDGWPSWSPDGTKIAFASGVLSIDKRNTPTTIKIVDVATLELQAVAGQELLPASSTEEEFVYSPTWSPTGDRLAYVSRRPEQDQGDGPTYRQRGDVYIVDLATGVATDVTRRRVPHADRVFWSPVDDQLLIYDFDRGTPWYDHGLTNIALLNLATDNIDKISNQAQTLGMPFWAPDGSGFAFTEGDNVVHVRRFGEGDRWINLNQSVASFITWSPDSSSIIVVAGDGMDSSFLVSLEDKTAQIVPFPLRFDASSPSIGPPQWSPQNPATPAQIVWPTLPSGEAQ